MLIAAARWYGLDAAAAGALRLSQSHLLPDDSSAHASWLLAAHQAGAISHDEFRTEARRYGLDGGTPPSSPLTLTQIKGQINASCTGPPRNRQPAILVT